MKRYCISMLWLLFLAVPIGVAVQNAVSWFALVGIAFFWFQTKSQAIKFNQHLNQATIFSVLYVLWLGVASYLNPASPASLIDWLGAVIGYAPWMFLPLLFFWLNRSDVFEPDTLYKVERFFLYWVLPIWALLVLSQYLAGWSVSGSELVAQLDRAEHFRPRGFYSHPLTLAYVALILWPMALRESLQKAQFGQGFMKTLPATLPLLSVGCILVLTASRTVQVVALMILGFLAIREMMSKRRQSALIGLCGVLVFIGAIAVTTAPKWQATLSEQGVDVQSTYRDDRLAFWHAHWEMFKERPVLGHGWKLGTEYRGPYYEKIGLGDFSKKYEAHNIFLQVLANGGIIGLFFFLAWGFSVWRLIRGNREFRLVILGLALASLTQNSLQDYEVRFVFTVVLILALFKLRERIEEQPRW